MRRHQEVTVLYNPEHTPLKNDNQIYVCGGWNRLRHVETVRLEMARQDDGWYALTLRVPSDAYMLDFDIMNRQGRDR
eukprot:9476014-Pyramimonas_sp.AAC.3